MAHKPIAHPLTLGKPFVIEKVGQIFVADGALFECTGIEPYRRKRDGVMSELAEMTAFCAKCGSPFTFHISVKGDKFYPTRKRELHRPRPALAYTGVFR